MRPIGSASDETVFEGVDVDVVDVPSEVVFVAYGVFPVTPLPDPVFALSIRTQGGPAAMTALVNGLFVRRQRLGVSVSFAGRVRMACRWSGRITMASMLNGAVTFVARKAARRASTWSTSAVDRRSAKVTVKKKLPPERYFADSAP
jgi:hypothetical protein